MAASDNFITVDQLRPDSKNVNLIVKVVESKVVMDRSKGTKGGSKVADCIVGDSTAAIVYAARDDQVEVAQPGSYISLHNAKVDVFRGSMRLLVDKSGKVEVAEDQDFRPAVGNNLSLIEFEMVTVPAAPSVPVTAV